MSVHVSTCVYGETHPSCLATAHAVDDCAKQLPELTQRRRWQNPASSSRFGHKSFGAWPDRRQWSSEMSLSWKWSGRHIPLFPARRRREEVKHETGRQDRVKSKWLDTKNCSQVNTWLCKMCSFNMHLNVENLMKSRFQCEKETSNVSELGSGKPLLPLKIHVHWELNSIGWKHATFSINYMSTLSKLVRPWSFCWDHPPQQLGWCTQSAVFNKTLWTLTSDQWNLISSSVGVFVSRLNKTPLRDGQQGTTTTLQENAKLPNYWHFFSEWNRKEMQRASGCPVASSACFYGNTVSGDEYTSTQFRTDQCIWLGRYFIF